VAQGSNLRISFNTSIFGLNWIGSGKMDPCPTLVYGDGEESLVQAKRGIV